MKKIQKYYELLSDQENESNIILVNQCPVNLRNKVAYVLTKAIANSEIKKTDCKIRKNSTNQSIGNQIAEHTEKRLSQYLPIHDFVLKPCSGPGYPDSTLINISSKQFQLCIDHMK